MSKHNYDHYRATGQGHIDPRFDLGHGRFLTTGRGSKRTAKSETARTRVENRARNKQRQRDERYLED